MYKEDNGRLSRTLFSLLHFFLFTSLFIALVAIGMVYQTAYVFSLTVPLSFYGFVFFGTLCSYNFHWLFTPALLPLKPSLKLSWHVQHRRLHAALAVISVIAAACFVLLLYQHWVWLLATAFLTFLYSAPKIPVAPFTGLRKIAYGKTVFLALAWMHITTQLPLLMVQTHWQLSHYLFAFHRFSLIYAICILFDLRDREGDQLEGVKSMITQMSLPQVGVIYYGILFFYFISSLCLLAHFPSGTVLALLVPGMLLLFYYQWFSRQTSDFVFYFLLDGLMVFSLPLMLLFPF